MCAKFTGFPAILYSGLWRLQIFGKLKRENPDLQIKIVVLTDEPPAFMVKVDKGEFEITILDEIKDVKDLETIECDAYLSASRKAIFGGLDTLMKGKEDGTVVIKNEKTLLTLLGKVIAAMGGL